MLVFPSPPGASPTQEPGSGTLGSWRVHFPSLSETTLEEYGEGTGLGFVGQPFGYFELSPLIVPTRRSPRDTPRRVLTKATGVQPQTPCASLMAKLSMRSNCLGIKYKL